MKPIQAIIIDDEKHARESLSSLVNLYCDNVTLIGKASNVTDGIALIKNKKPDLVFLDIAIGSESGFDLLNQLEKIDFQIIFTTGFSEFAIKAFKVNALDYLLKPIDPIDLQNAVNKYSKSRQQENQFTNLIEALHSGKPKHIAISSTEGISYVEIANIVHVKGSGNYSTFTLLDEEKIMASKSLKHFESLLPTNQFFRSHQSHLINVHHVKKILIQDGNVIELKNGDTVPLVRHRKEELMALMEN